MRHDKRMGTSGSITGLGCLHVRGYISLSISCVLNVCHLSSEPTPSFGAIFTLGRVINACDALNLGCPESTSARQSGTQNPLRLFFFFFAFWLLRLRLSTICWTFSFFAFLLMITTQQIFAPLEKQPRCVIWIHKLPVCICMSVHRWVPLLAVNEESVFPFYSLIYTKFESKMGHVTFQNLLFGEYSELRHFSVFRCVTPLLSKLSDNLQRELWALRGLVEIAPLAVLSGGAAGPRQCST